MKYGDIPKTSLDVILGETFEDSHYTLEDILNGLDEDIINTNFYKLPPGKGDASDLTGLVVYTQTYVGVVIQNPFGDLELIKLKRNP